MKDSIYKKITSAKRKEELEALLIVQVPTFGKEGRRFNNQGDGDDKFTQVHQLQLEEELEALRIVLLSRLTR